MNKEKETRQRFIDYVHEYVPEFATLCELKNLDRDGLTLLTFDVGAMVFVGNQIPYVEFFKSTSEEVSARFMEAFIGFQQHQKNLTG